MTAWALIERSYRSLHDLYVAGESLIVGKRMPGSDSRDARASNTLMISTEAAKATFARAPENAFARSGSKGPIFQT